MKKILALILCVLMLLTLVACGKDSEKDPSESNENSYSPETTDNTPAVSDAPITSEGASEEHDHTHINYRGRSTIFTAEDLPAVEGRECDFTYDQNGTQLYIYNNVDVDNMHFKQVQFSFTDEVVRISCTYSADKGTEEEPVDPATIEEETESAMKSFREALTAIYGEGIEGEQHENITVTWADHTGNYIILTRINDTTVQVAYYIRSAE